MKNKTMFILFFSLILISIEQILPQSGVGKLVGKVLDAESKEPLISASIQINETGSGALTDIDGHYLILNIVPGTYSIKFSYVGYGAKIVKDVRIVAGVTYELNCELTSNLTIDEIIVTGKKLFEEKATNTVKVIDSKDINKLPIKGIENLASVQAGVVIEEGSGGADGNATINVRGGRGNEVLYIIDGVPQNDLLLGGNYAQVSNSAIEQMSFQIGGYEAKYGQAQSGIINVTTKSGTSTYTLFSDILTSSFTDNYGYNLYTLNLGGPIIPDYSNHTFFISGERGYFKDANPSAIPLIIKTENINTNVLPNNSSDIWRFTAKTFHNLSPFFIRAGANINLRNSRDYIHSYAKYNSDHFPSNKDDNYSFSGKISHNFSSNSYWNLNIGYKIYKNESGDGLFFNEIEKYGDTLYSPYEYNTLNEWVPTIGNQGSRATLDKISLFYKRGRVYNNYTKTNNKTLTIDFDFTSQAENHLLEFGTGFQYNTLRYISLFPVTVAIDNRGVNAKSLEYRTAIQNPFFFGFDVTGMNFSDIDEYKSFNEYGDSASYSVKAKPKNPIIAYCYFQDRFELSDIVLNIGLRFDYFNTQADELRDETLPFGYGNPTIFDREDFVTKKPEYYFSPRIGIGFPVTTSTVFHAQYGKFIQPPVLINVLTSVNSLSGLLAGDNFGVNTGSIKSEITTQYEIGFRQILGDNFGALNITAFYKNIKGLINDETRYFQRVSGGQVSRYYGPANSDFGTVKGLALSLVLNRFSYFSFDIEYTYSIAEGTGSSTSSSTIAAFRNDNGETPKVIAPLSFDQRHTGVVTFDFSVPKNELGIFELVSLNLLFSFNSGRPYTPLLMQNITPGGSSNYGDTKGYVNSAFGPGSSRLDLKLEKSFLINKDLSLTPYLWIENLFDADNVITVYRSTGSAYSTGYLETEEGKGKAKIGGQDYIDDYKALEMDPSNFGIPRLIRLGFRMNFTGFNF